MFGAAVFGGDYFADGPYLTGAPAAVAHGGAWHSIPSLKERAIARQRIFDLQDDEDLALLRFLGLI